jgi:long-chain fatty acid transport protein
MLTACLAVVILGPVLAFGNGFYSPTVGQRASAMGGAFIGLADDYSAVHWNPAGITQIKGMEATVSGQDVVSFTSREGFVRYYGYGATADLYALGEIGATGTINNRIAPGFFFYTDAGPLRSVFDKVGVAAYTLCEYGSEWSGDNVLSNDDFVWHEDDFLYRGVFGESQDYESRVKTYVISPVVAKEVMPGLSVGVSANFAYSHFEMNDVFMEGIVDTIDDPNSPFPEYGLALIPVQMSDDVTGWGYGATVGVLYRASSRASVGLTLRTPITVSYDGVFSLRINPLWTGEQAFHQKSDFELTYPMWVGLGGAYRDFLFDGLTVTGDVQWTAWSSIDKIQRNIVWGGQWSPEDIESFEVFDTTTLNWEDTIEVAVGFDYRLGRSMSLNLGYRSSPSPSPDETYDFVLPMTGKNVIATGVTYRQDFWRATFALEYQAGDKRRLTGTTSDMSGSHVEDLLVPSLSFTYAF